jgi:Na+/melibiose symporter-like transporter
MRFLLGASLISSTGDWILRTGLAYQIYVLTGSTLASAGAVLASLLPQIALGSIAGVYADRWDRRRLMIGTNLLLAAVLLPLLAVSSHGRVWIVLVVLAASSCLAPFFQAAEQAMLPSLVPASRLVTANAANAQVRDVARLLGAALGGVVAGFGGIALLAVVDMVSFVVAAGLLVFLPRVAPARSSPSSVLGGWVDGVRIAFHSRTLRVIMIFTLITGFGEAVMGTLMAPFVHDVLGASARTYGTIMAAQAIGGLLGGLITTAIGHRFRAGLLLGWGAVAFGILDLVLFLYPLAYRDWWPAPVLMVVIGLPGALLVAGLMTVFQTATEDSHRGRIFGAAMAVEGVAMLAGTAAAGTLGSGVGIVPVIATQGAGYVVAGILVLATLPRSPVAALVPAVAAST